jgi:hypothetical protein
MLIWIHTFNVATRVLVAGDPGRAEQLATEALQVGMDSGQPDAALFFGAQLSTACLQRGTLGDMVPAIEQMAADVDELALGSALAIAHAEADRLSEAASILDTFAAAHFAAPLDAAWLTGMVGYAEAAITAGDPRYAGPLFDLLAPFAGHWSHTGALAEGPVDYFLGGLAAVLGRLEEADAHFAAAARDVARVGAPFFAARNGLRWGTMLATRGATGDAAHASRLIEEARAVATANGYGTVERRAAAALGSLGIIGA